MNVTKKILMEVNQILEKQGKSKAEFLREISEKLPQKPHSVSLYRWLSPNCPVCPKADTLMVIVQWVRDNQNKKENT
jgi:hypothetical protein